MKSIITILAACFLSWQGFAGEAAKWIWIDEPSAATNNVYAAFKTDFPQGADAVRIAVSGTYVAKIDGEVVAFGQYTDFPWRKTYTEMAIAPKAEGRTLEIEVWFSGNRFTSHFDGECGLWAEILAAGKLVGSSSSQWQGAILTAFHSGERSMISPSNNYTWRYDAAAAKKPLAWKNARELVRPVMSARPEPRPVEPAAVVRTLAGKKIAGDDTFALYDFGEETTGMLSFGLQAPQGTEIEILHGEFLRNGRIDDFAAVDKSGSHLMIDEFVADGDTHYTHWLRRYGLRYLEFRWQGGGVTLETPEILVVELPGMETPPFWCTDDLFVKMHEITCRTLRSCLHEKYENCPGREQSICAYDARNQMLFGYSLWGNYDRAAAMIRLFGEGERDDGYLPAAVPSARELVIPSFTFAWMCSVFDHARYSRDDALLKEQLPRIRRMLGKILSRRKGALYTIGEAQPGTRIWNYGAPVELEDPGEPPNAFYNLYLYETLVGLSGELARLGDGEGAKEYGNLAACLARALDTYWDEERALYADSFTPDGGREVFTGHNQALFLALDLVPRERVRRVLDAMKSGKVRLPELPILRYLVKGVFAHGNDDDKMWMHGQIRKIFGAMIDAGATTWWETTLGENYAPWASFCHGWSAMSAWYAVEYILGYDPTRDGPATSVGNPRVPGVRAHTRIATPNGSQWIGYRPLDDLKISRETVKIGLPRPVRILHVTDSHLERVDARDTEAIRRLAMERSLNGRELGEYYLDRACFYAREQEIPIVHTGDFVAYCSEAALEGAARRMLTFDIVACVGNHEFWLGGDRTNPAANRKECSGRLTAAFKDDIEVFVREIGGINFFVYNNVAGSVGRRVTDKFEATVAEGRPIVVACHIPLSIQCVFGAAAKLGGGDAGSVAAFAERIRGEKLVKAVLSGHFHHPGKVPFSSTATEFIGGATFFGDVRGIVFE